LAKNTRHDVVNALTKGRRVGHAGVHTGEGGKGLLAVRIRDKVNSQQ